MNSRKKTIDSDNYLTIEALADGLTAKLSSNDCEYCIDGDGDWKSLSENTVTEIINRGQKLMFRGKLIPESSIGIGTFTVSKAFNICGNVMSMLFGDEAKGKLSLDDWNSFFKLFSGCTTLESVSSNFLPATDISPQCYAYMFYGCTNLTNAPNLPATELYQGCYLGMFEYCKKLESAPKLPATDLVRFCYANMFDGCTNLKSIKAMFTTNPSDDYTVSWVANVASTGVFTKNKNATWDVRGTNGVPVGWTIESE